LLIAIHGGRTMLIVEDQLDPARPRPDMR
jgi:hypothetical protein